MQRLPLVDCRKGRWRTLFVALAVCTALGFPVPASAGIDDCVSAALNAADPNDLKLAAKFAAHHSECLPDLVPPEVIPYVLFSGSLDAANQSGALDQVGLAFGNSYSQCVNNLDFGKTAISKLSTVLSPICDNPLLSEVLNCNDLEGDAANEVNAGIASKIPILAYAKCGCAAATSGLGVEKIKDLVQKTKKCGATLAEIGDFFAKGGKGAYKAGKKVVEAAKDLGCKVYKLFGGGCSEAPPPPTGASEAANFCQSQGGSVISLESPGNQPNNYDVRCNNGAACLVEPGRKPYCETKAEYETYLENMEAANTQWCADRSAQHRDVYLSRCHDDHCSGGVGFAAVFMASQCKAFVNKPTSKDSNGQPTVSPLAILGWREVNEQAYLQSMEDLAQESETKQAQDQLSSTFKAKSEAHVSYCDDRRDAIRASYDPKCRDVKCNKGVHALANKMGQACIEGVHAAPRKDSKAAKLPTVKSADGEPAAPVFAMGPTWEEADELPFVAGMNKLVGESALRDPKAESQDVLVAYGCKVFISKDFNVTATCPPGAAINACKTLADKEELRSCMGLGTNSALKTKNVPTAPDLKVAKQPALANDPPADAAGNPPEAPILGVLKKLMPIVIPAPTDGGQKLPAVRRVDIAAVLNQNGCKLFLGRAGDWLCTEPKGLALCREAVGNGSAKNCRAPN